MHSDIFFDIFNYFRSEIIAREDGEQLEAAALPLVIRERDTEYQFHRIVLYDRLIKVKFALSTVFFPQNASTDSPLSRIWYTIFVSTSMLRQNRRIYLIFK